MSEYLNKLLQRKIVSYPNYIEHIRFPNFKKLKPGVKIEFNFPFTVFVGPNGCGKSSALQALYGCPNRMSTGDYWFTTSLDPIDNTPASRFIYQYRIPELRTSVEVIKARRHRKERLGRAANPDYWETARPSVPDGMQPMPAEFKKKEKDYRTESRWNAVKRDVVYIDFKSELSPDISRAVPLS